jgi:DNA-binding GntR family transcriptional regulator
MRATMAQTLPYRGLQLISEDIYAVLRQRILACELAPSERLEVNQIARQIGVSYTPVKDALRRLLAEGLISIRPRKGTSFPRFIRTVCGRVSSFAKLSS